MTTDAPNRDTTRLSELVASEIRALLARRGISRRQLAARIGVSHTWVTSKVRVTNPEKIDLDDLQLMAWGLDVPPGRLLPDDDDGNTLRYRATADRPTPATLRPGGRTDSHGPGNARPRILPRPIMATR